MQTFVSEQQSNPVTPCVVPQLNRPAQDLLMSMCMNCNTHGSDDMEVISVLIKIRLKPKVLLNHYMLCVRSVPSRFPSIAPLRTHSPV